jgi:AcrR family transcriptional regulator
VQHYGVMAEVSKGRGSHHRRRHRTSYHHGDLANALADAATEMARTGGPNAIVLRAAARAVGVSAAAAYRHFADHGELLQVVRRRALDSLAAAMQESLDEGEPLADPAQESLRRLRALGRAYIRFALTDPGLFRTAFCRPERPMQDATKAMGTQGPYALLSGVLDELVEHGVLEADRRVGAEIPAWASVHGLATLLIDGPLALLTAEERANAIERSSDFMLNGIRGHRDPAADHGAALHR